MSKNSPKESTSQRLVHDVSESLLHSDRGHHEEAKWDLWKDDPAPNVFQHLALAEDGGFSEVKDMYSRFRWATAAILLLFVAYNMIYLISLDLEFIQNPEQAVHKLGGTPEAVLDPFYLTGGLANRIGAALTREPDFFIEPVTVVAAVELLGVVIYLGAILVGVLYWSFSEGFWRWYFCMKICWDWIPDLSAYSSMKLLNSIVPTVFMARLFEFIGFIQDSPGVGRKLLYVLRMLLWLVFVVVAFMVGFDTFLMKLRVVAVSAKKPYAETSVVLPCVQFLVQVLGVVQLGPFVRKRLFVFIFGGEDGVLQEDEVELMDTWQALLARRMYQDLSFHQFVAVMLSFSDEDFQALVLNEDAEKRHNVLDVGWTGDKG